MSTMTASRATAVLFLRGVSSAIFLFVARAISAICVLRFATHYFGATYGGLIALLNQVTFYIVLAELGLAAATTSLLFEPVHSKSDRRVKALIAAMAVDVRRILAILFPAAIVATIALAFWLQRQVPFRIGASSFLLTAGSALLTLSALPYQSHLSASDRIPLRNVLLGCGFAAKAGLGVGLGMLMHSFIGLPLATAAVGLLELETQRRIVSRSLRGAVSTAEEITAAREDIHARAKFVIAHKVGYLFSYQSDYIILLISSSLSLLGFYAQYQYIYAGILSFTVAASGTFTARVARRQIAAGRQQFPSLYRRSAFAAAAAALGCGTGFYLLVGPAVHILYHTRHIDQTAVVLFSVLLMLNIYKLNDDMWIDTTGTYERGFLLPLGEACSYVLLGLCLVHLRGIHGVLIAGIITNIVFSVTFKSAVIGAGVMNREIASTVGVKLRNLAAVGTAFAAIASLAH